MNYSEAKFPISTLLSSDFVLDKHVDETLLDVLPNLEKSDVKKIHNFRLLQYINLYFTIVEQHP